jgi:hypothetical protein
MCLNGLDRCVNRRACYGVVLRWCVETAARFDASILVYWTFCALSLSHCLLLRRLCRVSDAEITPPTQSPKTATTVTSSRQPFSAASSPAASEATAEDDAHHDDDESEDISSHVARAGVVSGKMYRKSVLVSSMPKAADAPPQKEGYLMKKSPAMLVGWQKRFFVTNSNGDIEYFKSVSYLCP